MTSRVFLKQNGHYHQLFLTIGYCYFCSKIYDHSSHELVGLGADPEEKNKVELFHAAIINDSDKVNEEMSQ